MKLKNVIIKNYKSFGEKDNDLFIDKLNVIIGKNESGKSNIIDCLAGIDMIGFTNKEYFYPKNRKNNQNIEIELNFETYKKEFTYNGFKGTATLLLKSYGEYLLSGELSEFITNNKRFNEILNQIENIDNAGLSFSQPDNKRKFYEIYEMLKVANSKIFVKPKYYDDFIKNLKNVGSELQKDIANLIEDAYNFLENTYIDFPNFVKIENLTLKSKYSIEEVQNDILLEKFLEICKINKEDLILRMNSKDTSDIRNYEEDINENINKNFTDVFNGFYKQENVKIKLAITEKEITFMVDTTKRYLDYDERSNGLKWYLSIFIQLQHMENHNCKSAKNNIILMDEPGVYLHPNAQREVVKLFDSLIKNENQIIYTTHSPFMVDTKSVQNVRAVIKDEEGVSHVYNKITTIPTNSKSTYDTITPLTNALGLDLNYNIGPSFNNKNIIVEGISDYFYLQAYYYIKNKKNVPNIIPSTGGNNIPTIASILFGWHCDFNILLDQDKKGHSIYDSIMDSSQPFLEKVIFIDGNTNKLLDKDFEIEDLFSSTDKIKFGISNEDYSEHKYNYSYNVYNKVLLGEDVYDNDTIKRFDKIINKVIVSRKAGD